MTLHFLLQYSYGAHVGEEQYITRAAFALTRGYVQIPGASVAGVMPRPLVISVIPLKRSYVQLAITRGCHILRHYGLGCVNLK